MVEVTSPEKSSRAPRVSGELLSHSFAWLDELLRTEVRAMREALTRPIDEFHGLYVSDERVDQILSVTQEGDARLPASVRADASTPSFRRIPGLDAFENDPVWGRLQRTLELSLFELAVLLLGLAPEVDLKYETVYAYLNNDVTRKWATRDLALKLFRRFVDSEHDARNCLSTNGVLYTRGLLKSLPIVAEHPAWRAGGFLLEPMVAHALMGASESDANLPAVCRLNTTRKSWGNVVVSDELRWQLGRLDQFFTPKSRSAPLLVFEGRSGNEQRSAAIALATALGVNVLSLDVRLLGTQGEKIAETLKAALLHQTLYGTLLFIEGLDTLREIDHASAALVRNVVSTLTTATGPVVVVCDEGMSREVVDGFRALTLRFDLPSVSQRIQLWDDATAHTGVPISTQLRDTVASRFILTPEQIYRAAQASTDEYQITRVFDMQELSDSKISSESMESVRDVTSTTSATSEEAQETESRPQLSTSHVFEAARTQTRIALGALARRINCVFTYKDLVLPEVTAQQVKEIAEAIRCRETVYNEWDFSRRLPQGQGLKVLFSGPSGTGKTMAAAVIAREVGLDLYAIDLSGIVSKYIGETEKNLDRVFRAAHCANAILFFDECDALFGKRSEVKDAHDRYANIEVAYLLQKMESHEGAVILATNFSRNMDLAFSRRMQYVVEFPIPDEPNRERLWRGMFPERTPLSDDVDFPFLARHFSIAGGDIRNVVLDAAFLAAQNGRVITMQHLIRAMARQFVKQGQSPSPTHFKHYFSLLSRDS